MKLEPPVQRKIQREKLWLQLRFSIARFLCIESWQIGLCRYALKRASFNDYALAGFSHQIITYHETPVSDNPTFNLAYALLRSQSTLEDWKYRAIQAEAWRAMYVKLLLKQFPAAQLRLADKDIDFVVNRYIPKGFTIARTLSELYERVMPPFLSPRRVGL